MAINQRPRGRPTLLATISLIIFVKKLQACAKSKPEYRASAYSRKYKNKDEIKNALENDVFKGHQKRPAKNAMCDHRKLVEQIDNHTRTSIGPLSDVAANEPLLLEAKPFVSRHTSSKHLASDIQATRCYLSRLQGCTGVAQDSSDKWLGHGKPLGILIDVKFLANLEHLLLRHLEALLSHLAANIWIQVAMVIGIAQQVFGEEYFTEYQDGRRRQTTTWPWCIKSSLAILWGVCWKFVMNPNQRRKEDQPSVCPGLEFNQFQVQDPWSLAVANEPFYYNTTGSQDVSVFFNNTESCSPCPSWNGCLPGIVQPQGSNIFGESFSAPKCSPQIEALETSGVLYNAAGVQVYQSYQDQTSTYLRANPNAASSEHSPHHVPSPRFSGSQLEDVAVDVEPWISEESQARQIQETLELYNQPCHSEVTLQIPNSDVSNTYNPSSNSPFDKTSWEDATKAAMDCTGSSTPSGASSTSFGHSINRPGKGDETDPPVDDHGRYYCSVCAEKSTPFFFKRPCEWKKHMDKHQRPYICSEPQCHKLSGFTYSGGLARHEREVHGKGAIVEKLYCPHPTCKRSKRDSVTKDKPFTRKENLLEHIRRLHTDSVTGTSSPDPTGKKRKKKNSPSDESDANSDASNEDFSSETKRLRRECEDLRILTKQLTGKMDQMEEFIHRKIEI